MLRYTNVADHQMPIANGKKQVTTQQATESIGLQTMSISEAKSEYTAAKNVFSPVQQLTGTSVPTTDRVIIVWRLERVSVQYNRQKFPFSKNLVECVLSEPVDRKARVSTE
jgi:hypothetical protein